MITFILCLTFLTGMYFIYGRYIDKIFAPDRTRQTPACTLTDGVDYVPMSNGKIFLIQFLNIAGLGPIFGAVMGAMYGPVVFLWIVFGTIFGGAVHDYLAGMVSLRNKGKSLPDIIGDQLGLTVKQVMRVFIVVLMILVGVVFVSGPAGLLAKLTGGALNYPVWVAIILIYYILATLFPIDKIIGRIYPVFGFALLFMAVGILIAMFIHAGDMQELTLARLGNMHPKADTLPLFPMLFITVACGAISGFHATQSPLMARCLKNEGDGRKIFFGAMVAEGIVALIWAAAAMCFFGNLGSFQSFMAQHGNSAAIVVDAISHGWLGQAGAVLALLGVIAAPITSADTAFRSARLIIADFLNFSQKELWRRIAVSAPLFVICFLLLLMSEKSFDIIWRYFAWSNQTLAAFTLWALTVYLVRAKKNYFVTLLPAVFMTAVCSVYILIAKEGFSLPAAWAYGIGAVVTAGILGLFIINTKSLLKR
jgi:carbon starvation protein CstA